MQLVKNIPYLLLIVANLVYLSVYGFKPLQYHPKLVLYNFLIFLLVGVIIFFKLSYHLYQWFVKGEGDTKQRTRVKIQELFVVVQMIGNYFRPGNLYNLVYLYAILSLWTLLSYLVPQILLGLFFGFLHELKTYVYDNYPNQIFKFKESINALITKLQAALPRYCPESKQQANS